MRKTKSISFDLTDEYEVELMEYAENQGRYFSRYIKRLIDQDRKGILNQPAVNSPKPEQTHNIINTLEVSDDDKEYMSNFL